MKRIKNINSFSSSNSKNKGYLRDYYANFRIEKILELNKNELKKLVLEELKKDQPNLKFLFSDDVMKLHGEIFDELLKEDERSFEEKLKIKDEDITFDIFVEKTNLDIFWAFYSNIEYIGVSEKLTDLFNKKEVDIEKISNNQTKYSKRYYKMLKYCLNHSDLDEEQKKIIKDKIIIFEINGVNLEKSDKNKLEEINKKIVELGTEFKNNADDVKKDFFIFAENNIEFLRNIDEETLEIAKNNAEKKGENGYAFDFQKNTIEVILEGCSDSNLRKQYYEEAYSLAISGEKNNNKISIELIKLKNKRAKILGYNSPQDLISVGKIMENKDEVKLFLDDFLKGVKIKYKDEIDEIKEEFGLKEVFAWDVPFYLNELKKRKYSFDKSELKDYLEFETIKKSMFSKAEELYGIEIKKIENSNLQYRDDVEVYEIYKDSKLISYFIGDYYSKENKITGGAASIFSYKKILKNGNVTVPVVSNFMSVNKSKKGETFLTLGQSRTLFHEFGHAMSEVLVESKYSEMGGFGIEGDALELASRYFEEFILNPDKIGEVLINYKNGESFPDELIEKYRKSELLGFGNNKMRQLFLAYLDLSMHSGKEFTTIEEFAENFQDIVNDISFLDRGKYHEEGTFKHPVLGYGGKYYVYLLGEVLASYAHKYGTTDGFFDFFKEGIKKGFWENFNNNTKGKFNSKPYFERNEIFSPIFDEEDISINNIEVIKTKKGFKYGFVNKNGFKYKNKLEKKRIKNLIFIELDKSQPDLKYLSSLEVIEKVESILEELLEKDKKSFEKILNTPDKNLKFEFFNKKSKFSKLFGILHFIKDMGDFGKLRKIIDRVEIKKVGFAKKTSLSKKYFEKLNYCLENCNLDEEQRKIIKLEIDFMEEQGANLSEENHAELIKIGEKLKKIQTEFQNNVKEGYNKEFEIINKDDIKDIHENHPLLIEAKERAEKTGKEGFIFTLQPQTYVLLRAYIEDENLREKYIKEFEAVASETNKEDLLKNLELKNKTAKIRGSKNFAELTSKKMFLNSEEVEKLLKKSAELLGKKSEKEINLIKEFIKSEKEEELGEYLDLFGTDSAEDIKEIRKKLGIDDEITIKQTDYYYYERKYREKNEGFNSSEFSEYFEYENVKEFLFDKIGKQFGFRFEKDDSVEGYAEGVENYKIYEGDKLVANLVFDMFDREGKKNGANAGYLFDKEVGGVPYISLSGDMNKGKDGNTLLNFYSLQEVMFHEFGHLLHLLSSKSKYSELSGWNNLETDVMELPSKILEKFLEDKNLLMKLGKHYKTGNKIPEKLVDKFLNSSNFGDADKDTIQVVYSVLDRFLHSKDFNLSENLDEELLELVNTIFYLPKEEGYKRWYALNRVLAEGYGGAYYSYLFGPILASIIFKKFKNGFLSEENIEKFKKEILEVASEKDFKEIWKEYMGKEFDIDEILDNYLKQKNK